MLASPMEWSAFYADLKRKTGIDLNLYKADQMQRRILGMAESKGCANIGELMKRMQADPSLEKWFLDKMAINVTELFRNPEKWEELRTKVLPGLLQRSPRLKCWSAGCSIGAEAATLSILFAEHFPGSHSIVGTDIDDGALAQANRLEFNDQDMRGVAPALRAKYFGQRDGLWQAKPEVRRYATFRKQNLLSDPFDGGFDLILCRNVVIYFTNEAKDKLYERFLAALKPGGVLFVGSTERIFNARQLGYESTVPFFYQRPLQGETQWRNAS